MMSYLWILLLGSLLATSAKAQDDPDLTEEAAADPETPAPDAAEVDTEPEAVEETDHTGEETPTESTPELEAENEEAVTPAVGDAEPADAAEDEAEPTAPADDDTDAAAPADDDTDATAPADDDTDATAPADDDTDAAAPTELDPEPVTSAPVDPESADEDAEAATPTPAAGDVEEVTPAEADAEVDGVATTQEPAVDPEVDNAGDELPTANAEDEPTSGPDDEATTPELPAAHDDQEEPTDPAAGEETTDSVEGSIVPEIKTEIHTALGVPVPTVNVAVAAPEVNSGFNLEDALQGEGEVDNKEQPGKSRSLEAGAHAAGATGEADQPQAQEASSSSLAGILCGIVVAAVGAVAGYFTYQKKKLCFKNRQEADPEAARKADTAEAQSDPQVLSTLLNSS